MSSEENTDLYLPEQVILQQYVFCVFAKFQEREGSKSLSVGCLWLSVVKSSPQKVTNWRTAGDEGTICLMSLHEAGRDDAQQI